MVLNHSRRSVLQLAAVAIGGGIAGCANADLNSAPSAPNNSELGCELKNKDLKQEGPSQGSFQTYQANPRHTGYVPTKTDSKSKMEYWRSALDTPPGSSWVMTPAISGGRVYATGAGLYALNQTDGSLEWCTDVGTSTPTSPTVAEGTVIVGTSYTDENSGLQAFDATNGNHRWHAPEVDSINAPPTVYDGTVYISGSRNNPSVGAVDLASGNVVWQTEIGETDEVTSSPSVRDDGVYVHRGNHLYRLNLNDGSEVWTKPAYKAITPPTLGDDMVYTRHGKTTFGAYDVTNGNTQWTYDDLASGGPAVTSSCVTNGKLYLSSGEKFVALNVSNGATKWERSYRELLKDVNSDVAQPHGTCLVTTDRIYLGVGSGLAALARTNGTLYWYARFSGRSEGDAVYSGKPGTPALAGGVVYVLTQAGNIHALRA